MREALWEDLYQPPVCEICDTPGDVARYPIMWSGFTCEDCFYIWYEHGATRSEYVREHSLKRKAERSQSDADIERSFVMFACEMLEVDPGPRESDADRHLRLTANR